MAANNAHLFNLRLSWQNVLFWGSFAVAVLMGVLYTVAPYFVDDLWYSLGCLECTDRIERAAVVWANVCDHLQWDTGRLAHFFAPLFLALAPKWVYGILAAIAVWVTLWAGCRYIGKHPVAGAAWITFYILCMPWLDHLVSVIYGINYVWTSSLAVILLWGTSRLSTGIRLSRPVFVSLCAAAFVAGWMHEGFAVPMAAGFFVYDCAMRLRVSRQMLILQACLVAGLVVLISFPAIWTRGTQAVNPLLQKPVIEIIVDAGIFNCMFWLYAGVCCWLRLRHKILQREESAEMLMILTFGAVGTTVMMLYYFGPRTSWFIQLVCGLGLLRLLCRHWHPKLQPWLRGTFVCISLLTCIVNVVAAIDTQTRLTREMNEVLEAYRSSPNGVVYRDIIMPKPDLTLMKTSVRNLMVRVPLSFIQSYEERDVPLVILPESMRDFDPATAEVVGYIPGAVYKYRGSLVARANTINCPALLIDYKGLGPTVTRFRASQFTCKGDTFVLIQPHVSVMFGSPEPVSVGLPQ